MGRGCVGLTGGEDKAALVYSRPMRLQAAPMAARASPHGGHDVNPFPSQSPGSGMNADCHASSTSDRSITSTFTQRNHTRLSCLLPLFTDRTVGQFNLFPFSPSQPSPKTTASGHSSSLRVGRHTSILIVILPLRAGAGSTQWPQLLPGPGPGFHSLASPTPNTRSRPSSELPFRLAPPRCGWLPRHDVTTALIGVVRCISVRGVSSPACMHMAHGNSQARALKLRTKFYQAPPDRLFSVVLGSLDVPAIIPCATS